MGCVALHTARYASIECLNTFSESYDKNSMTHLRLKATAPSPAPESLDALLARVGACALCANNLPLGPRPVLQVHPAARLLIAGQAPGRKVHASGIPFDDASGDRLRSWLGITRECFYDAQHVAILPMGFCYPGTGKSGDLPPRPECAPAWRNQLLAHLPNIKLTLVVGRYALPYHLSGAKGTLADIMQGEATNHPTVVVLPHPSPRNQLWLRRNPWFEAEQLPVLRQRVMNLLGPVELPSTNAR